MSLPHTLTTLILEELTVVMKDTKENIAMSPPCCTKRIQMFVQTGKMEDLQDSFQIAASK